MQNISTQSFIHDEIDDLDELADALVSYHNGNLSYSEINKILNDGFLFGYKSVEEDKSGFCYAFKANGNYFIDACNNGLDLFYSVSAVKKLRDRLFADHTDTIYCGYDDNDRRSRILCKRAGFRELGAENGTTIFILKRS